MNTYTIHVYQSELIYEHYKFTATFDGYDGAPIDNETPSNDPIGWGDTPYEAIHDLIQNALDKGLIE